MMCSTTTWISPLAIVLLASCLSAWEITLEPTENFLTNKKSGDNIVVTCIVDGIPEEADAPVIQWLKAGTPIETTGSPYVLSTGRDRLQMYLMNAQKSVNGQYVCRVTYDGVTKQSPVQISLYESVEFTDAPEQQHPEEGTTARVRCRVSGEPKPEIFWFRNNQQVSSDVDERYSLEESNQVLVVANFSRATDDGAYTCQPMQTQTASVLTRVITVEGYVAPKITTPLPVEGMEGLERKNLELTCEATGVPKPTFSWFHGTPDAEGSAIVASENGKYLVTPNGRLTIALLAVDDAGQYSCRAENALGADLATTAVTVFRRPRITRVANQTLAVGAQTSIECRYEGDGDVSVTWHYDGGRVLDGTPQELPEGEAQPRIRVVSEPGVSRLSLDGLELADAGAYRCRAENAAGVDETTVWLAVTRAPELLSPERQTIRAAVEKTVVLECRVEATPKPEWSWSFNDVKIDGTATGSKYEIEFDNEDLTTQLVLKTDTVDDFGVYTCTATNGYGQPAVATFNVIEVERPPTPGSITLADAEPNFALASVENYAVDSLPESQQPSLVVFEFTEAVDDNLEPDFTSATQAEFDFDTANQYQILGMKPTTQYFIRVKSLNDAGETELSAPTPYKTSEPLTPDAPSLTFPAYGAVCSLDCEIAWTEADDRGSPLTKYTIEYRPVTVDGEEITELGETVTVDDVDESAESLQLHALAPTTTYRLRLYAHNARGTSRPAEIVFSTSHEKLHQSSVGGSGGLPAVAVLLLVVAVLLVLLVVIDVACYLLNRCGVLMFVCVNFLGRTPPDSVKELEEGATITRFDEKKPLTADEGAPQQTTVVLKNGDGNGATNTASKATVV